MKNNSCLAGGSQPKRHRGGAPLARTESLAIFELANRRLMDQFLAGGISTVLYGGMRTSTMSGSESTRTSWTASPPGDGERPGSFRPPAPIGASRWIRGGNPRSESFPRHNSPRRAVQPIRGASQGVRDFVATSGHPAILYLKDPSVLPPDAVARLIDGGEVVAIKYGVSHLRQMKTPTLPLWCRRWIAAASSAAWRAPGDWSFPSA